MTIIYCTIYFLVCRIITYGHYGRRWHHIFMHKAQELKVVQFDKY